MTCRETLDVLSRYLDRELPAPKVTAVEAHLAHCPACRAEHAAQAQLWAVLGAAEAIRAPDLYRAIEARLAAPRGWAAFLDGLRLRTVGYATATAILVGIFVGAGVWAGTVRRGDPAQGDFAELLGESPPGMEFVVLMDQIGETP